MSLLTLSVHRTAINAAVTTVGFMTTAVDFEPFFIFDKTHPSHFAPLPFCVPGPKKAQPCTKR